MTTLASVSKPQTIRPERSLACQLIGVWALVSYVDEHPGIQDAHPFGPQPEGFLIYTADGFVSAQLMRPGRPPFSSSNWHHGTPQEYQVSGSGYIAYCGMYEVDEENATVTHIASLGDYRSPLGSTKKYSTGKKSVGKKTAGKGPNS